MKKQLLTLLLIMLTGQTGLYAQSSTAEQLAAKIADRMRDTLSLSTAQRAGIYAINLQLHEQKMNIRRDPAVAQASLGPLIQGIENTRDSLYRSVITDQQLFDLYKMKKAQLVKAN